MRLFNCFISQAIKLKLDILKDENFFSLNITCMRITTSIVRDLLLIGYFVVYVIQKIQNNLFSTEVVDVSHHVYTNVIRLASDSHI